MDLQGKSFCLERENRLLRTVKFIPANAANATALSSGDVNNPRNPGNSRNSTIFTNQHLPLTPAFFEAYWRLSSFVGRGCNLQMDAARQYCTFGRVRFSLCSTSLELWWCVAGGKKFTRPQFMIIILDLVSRYKFRNPMGPHFMPDSWSSGSH